MSRPVAVILGDLNMLRCFANSDVEVFVASTDEHDPTLWSRHARASAVIAPFSNADGALADLERIAAGFPTKPVLFYGTDEQLLFVSRHRERLAQSYRFLMPDAELVETLVDKHQFGRFALHRRLPVPAHINSRHATPSAVLATVGLPCVIKPEVHIGWFQHEGLHSGEVGPRKAMICTTEQELADAWAEVSKHVPEFVIQRYIPGDEDHVYSFHAYVDASGKVQRAFVGKKIRTYPKRAGVSTYLELVEDPAVMKLGAEIVAKAGVVGPVKLDIKRNAETGELFLLEINARFNLWHRLGAAAGVNLPMVAYDDLAGGPAHEIAERYATDVRWLAFGDDFRSFLRSYHPSGLSWGDWVKSLRGRKVFDVFAWDDPVPLLATAASYVRALAHRVTHRS